MITISSLVLELEELIFAVKYRNEPLTLDVLERLQKSLVEVEASSLAFNDDHSNCVSEWENEKSIADARYAGFQRAITLAVEAFPELSVEQHNNLTINLEDDGK